MWRSIIRLALITLISWPLSATSGLISIQSQLGFGEIVVRDNSREQVYSITPDGAVSIDSGIVVIEPGRPGELLLHNFPVNTQLSISIQTEQETTQFFGFAPDTAQFRINIYTYSSTINTNAQGEAIIRIGANLITDGTGRRFVNGRYLNTHTLNIDY